MRRLMSVLTAVVLGLIATTALSGMAQADGAREYRVVGCDQAEDVSPVPGANPAFVVVSSFVPEELGQPCEAVLTSLGSHGFRLIEVRVRSEIFGGGIPTVGVLHYLERRGDEVD